MTGDRPPPPVRVDPIPPPTSPAGSPRGDAAPPWREAAILSLAAVVLTVVHYHGLVPGLGPGAALYGWFAVNVAALLVVPLLLVRLVLREPVAAFGLGRGRPRTWLRESALVVAALAPLVVIAARVPWLHAGMPRYRAALDHPWLLVPSTLGWGAYFFAWEFFFRGFLLLGLGRRLGATAIFVQLVPFVLVHHVRSEAETLVALGAGVVLGALGWRGRSMLGPWLVHWTAATALNVLVVLWR